MNDCFPGEGRKKITSLFSNDRRYNRSGSITTATADREDPLKKSRISNLPEHKRDTLQCRLDFVVVFQTIQIQRLSVQIESLRVRLADSERQIFNYRNYEVQIKQLTERCYEYEKEKADLQQHIEQINFSLQNAQAQAKDFREKGIMLEQALHEQEDVAFRLKEKLIIEQRQRQQSEEGRLLLQSSIKQKERLYTRQIRDLEKSTQLRRSEPTKNEQHLNNLLKKYHQQVSTLQRQNQTLRGLYDSIEQQSQDLQRRYEELQQQFYRTNEQLKEKDFQIEGMEQQNHERQQLLQQRYEEEYNGKCRRIQQLEQQISQWKTEIEKMETQHEQYQFKIVEYGEQCEKYEGLLNQAGDEIDRLNTIIKDKIKYLEAWQNRYKELQEEFNGLENVVANQQAKIASDQEETMRLTHALKYKTELLDKLEKVREQEAKAVREKLQQIEVQRQEIATIKKQKELQRDDQRRKEVENMQLKDQINRKIAQGNQLFEDLNKVEALVQTLKMQLATSEGAHRVKDEELAKAKEAVASVDQRIEKIQSQKRALQQQAMRVKALQERIRHEQLKKGEYLNESKKLSQKLKESDKSLLEARRRCNELSEDLERFQKYTEQLIEKTKELEEKLQYMAQLQAELSQYKQSNKHHEQEIIRLKQVIHQKIHQLTNIKEKIVLIERGVKEMRLKEEEYQNRLREYEKMEAEIKLLKKKIENLQDKNEKVEGDLASAMVEIEQLSKQNGSLQRVIAINGQQLSRCEKLLQQSREQLLSQKSKQKELLSKLKQHERRIKHAEQDIQKQRDRLLKQKTELQKLIERKNKEHEADIKTLQSSRDNMARKIQKEIKENRQARQQIQEENVSLRMLLKKMEEEKEKTAKNCRELEKKIAVFEHELERTAESGSEALKQLQISKNNIEKMSMKARETEDAVRQQAERIAQLLSDKQRLLAEIADQQRVVTGKQQDIVQLIRENQLFQSSIQKLQEEQSMLQQRYGSLCEQLIKIKFQSEGINSAYMVLKTRTSNMQKMIVELKNLVSRLFETSGRVQSEKKKFQLKFSEYQEKMTAQIQRLQQLQYKAGQEIIRLDTMNRILQIQIGEYKEREIAVFSIVKEGSMIKQRKQLTPIKEKDIENAKELPLKDLSHSKKETYAPVADYLPMESPKSKKTLTADSRGLDKSLHNLKDSRLMKSSIFGQAEHMIKSRCFTTRFDEQPADISYCQKRNQGLGRQNLLKQSKNNRLYFDNLVFKQT